MRRRATMAVAAIAVFGGLVGCKDRSASDPVDPPSVRPVRVGDGDGDAGLLDGVEHLALGLFHGCALRAGEVYCWGQGIGAGGSGSTAARVDGLPPIAQLRSAGRRTCALGHEGDLYCWGERLGGSSGGRPGQVYVHDGGRVPASLAIQWGRLSRIDFGRPVAEVGVGMTHICARTVDGVLYCWGSANGGPLPAPAPIDRPERLAEGVESVEVGHAWTCFTAGGKRSCRGSTPGLGDIAEQQNAKFLGWRIASCGVQDGNVRCMGRSRVVYGGGPVPDEPGGVIVTVPGIDHVARLSLGARHACALRDDGAVWCWGDSTFKQAPGWTPAAIELGGPAIDLDSGQDYSCAVMAADMTLRCWGADDQGQAGGTAAPSPIRMRDDPVSRREIPTIRTAAAERLALESQATPAIEGSVWSACLRQPRDRECTGCRYTLRFGAKRAFVAEARCGKSNAVSTTWTGRWRRRGKGDAPVTIDVRETPAPSGARWRWDIELSGRRLSGNRRIDDKEGTIVYFVEGELAK